MISGDALTGTVVDNRYRLTKKIGKGSFGWVFEATEEMAGQYVGQAAVKLLAPEDETQRDMVLREIRALAGLTHEFIIGYRTSGQISDGPLAGSIFLVTELGEEALAQVLQSRARLPQDEVWTLGRGISSALAYVHAKGSVHRDVKPENILRVDGRWKLGDFGLARAVEGAQMSASGAKGTLRYMAPEVLKNEITGASDVYALGVTLLRSLTGRYAHEGGTEGEFMANLMTKPPTFPPELPDVWRTILSGCLERDPHGRWTAGYLAEQFEVGPAALSTSVDRAACPQEPVAAVGVPHSAASSTLPPVLDQPDVQDRTIRIDDHVSQTAESLSDMRAKIEDLSGGVGAESQSTAQGVKEAVASLQPPPLALRLAAPQDASTEYVPQAVDTYFDRAVRRDRRGRGRARFLRFTALLVLLAVGAVAYAWRSGTIGEIVQRVKYEAVEGLVPSGGTPRVVELTVLADGPVTVRKEPRTDAPSLGALMRNARVKTIGKSGEWYQLLMPTGGVAWIHQSAFLGGDSHPAPSEHLMKPMQLEGRQSPSPERADDLRGTHHAGEFEERHSEAAGASAGSPRQPTVSDRFPRNADDARVDRMKVRRAMLRRLKQRCQQQPDLPVCRRLRRLSR